jgi:predicted nucleotidyltransferase
MTNESTKFGLTFSELETITNEFKKFPEVKKAYIFGSRAIGNFKPSSDIDLAISGTHIDSILTTLWGNLENNTPLPYKFDLINLDEQNSNELALHILSFGVLIYQFEN